MRRITLRQLEVFEAIARLNSFTRAAEEMHLTQPTVSMQIRKLTECVGLPLFEQIGKKIFLTAAGKELYATCRDMLGRLDRFGMSVADLMGLKQGHLQIAVVTTAKYFTPRLLGPFCQRYPGIEVSLKVSNRERILERLANNEDDLYILGQPPEELDVHYEPFMENPMVVIAPLNHPLAGEKHISLARLAEEPFLMREAGSGTRKSLERLFSAHGLTPKVRMELGSNEAIKQAIVGGLGVSVLSRHTLALDAAMGQLTILDVEHFPIRRHWYAVYPAGKQPSVVAKTFLEYLYGAAAELNDLPAQGSVDGNPDSPPHRVEPVE